MGFEGLTPSIRLLLAGLFLDAILGDPQVSFHPIRLMGGTLSSIERGLRRVGLDGYGGGCALFVALTLLWAAVPSFLIVALERRQPAAAAVLHVLIVYVLFALRDLVDHVRHVQIAARRDDLPAARRATALFVGRDTKAMDLNGCRRAAIESLSESFVDGFLSPLFWYVLAGLPGLLVFKVVSTMDSMVGYKNDRYRRFGWCGARLDDLMNYIPARLSWILLGFAAIAAPGLSAQKGWRIGLRQHSTIPGPNAGWSETTMAGVLQRRLIGPIWKGGVQVTDVWLGDAADPEGGSDPDVSRALAVTLLTALLSLFLAITTIHAFSLSY